MEEVLLELPNFGIKKSCIEEVFLRFTHLENDIFDSLDNTSIVRCRKRSRDWKSFIDNQKFHWIRIIKQHDKRVNKNHFDNQLEWKKLFKKIKIEAVRNFGRGIIFDFDFYRQVNQKCLLQDE